MKKRPKYDKLDPDLKCWYRDKRYLTFGKIVKLNLGSVDFVRVTSVMESDPNNLTKKPSFKLGDPSFPLGGFCSCALRILAAQNSFRSLYDEIHKIR